MNVFEEQPQETFVKPAAGKVALEVNRAATAEVDDPDNVGKSRKRMGFVSNLDEKDQLSVVFGGSTSTGPKPRNEDAFAAKQPDSSSVRTIKGVVACIADGLSSSEDAQQASQTSVATFIDDYYSTPDTWDVKKSAARVLNSINSWLYHQGIQTSSGYGSEHNTLLTTFSAVVLKSTTAHLLHAGDSRIYLVRKGALHQLTKDHSHKRAGNKPFLTRALGMDSRLEVDYLQEEVEQGDILLLTTDGVHDFVRESQLLQFICQSDESLESRAKKIIAKAEAQGSDDNLSCLMMEVKGLPSADIDEVHRRLTQLAIPPEMTVGQKIDSFEVLRVIHSGTRSHLYLVKDNISKQLRVLKAPSENFSEDPLYLEGFIREQWIGRRINHPSVMTIYPRPESSPFLYHVCEYIEGSTLRQWILDNPKPSLEKVRELTKAMISALRVLQRMGMVHRDLKPENVMLDEKGQVHLIDFGTVQVDGLDELGSLIDEDVPVGSVNYIAPEYLRGGKGTYQSDLFSLAVMVYEMITGELPHKIPAAQLRQPQSVHTWRYIPLLQRRDDLPVWLDLALAKACSEAPGERYMALSEFMQDLCTPNKQLLSSHAQAPLLQKNPLLFWQCTSAVLVAVVIIQAWIITH